MPYTVNKLAKLSGVSARTLRFYDEIGLLKPAYYGNNNYRYYGEEQLLLLQQILFYRELDLPLVDIQKILYSGSFDKIEALESHRKRLEADLTRTQSLVKTIDKTIAHLRGELKMKDEELYYGFDSEKQRGYEKELVEKGVVTQSFMEEYKKKIAKWTDEDKESFLKEGKEINRDLCAAISQELTPSSPVVQKIIQRHHAWVGWNPTKEKYMGLTQLYQTSDFKKFYDAQHPKLLAFIVEAMRVYAEENL